MTVFEFQHFLVQHAVPGDALIFVPGSDHSFRLAHAEDTTAISYPKERYYCEDHGDEYIEPGGKRISALLIT